MKTSGGEELAKELAAIEPVRASSLAGCNLPVDGLVGPDIGLRRPGREIGSDFWRLRSQRFAQPFADWQRGPSFSGQDISGVVEGPGEDFQLYFLREVAEVEMSFPCKSLEGLRDQIIREWFSAAIVKVVEVIVEKFMQAALIDPVPRNQKFVVERSKGAVTALEVRGDLRKVPPEEGFFEGSGFQEGEPESLGD